MPPPKPVPDTRSPTATIDDQTAAAHTVAELAQFWRQTRSLPGKSAKHLSDIRSATRLILRALALADATPWDSSTVEQWCAAFAETSHGQRLTTHSLNTYQQRLRLAAELFHDIHHPPSPPPAVAAGPAGPRHNLPLPLRTLDDLQLMAAAWQTTAADVVTRLVAFYRAAHPTYPTAERDDVPVHRVYKGVLVRGTYHRRTRNLTITTPPLAGQQFPTPSAAAGAVILAVNSGKVAANRSGWDFWLVSANGQVLRTLRHQ